MPKIRAKTKRGIREAIRRFMRDIVQNKGNPHVRKLLLESGAAMVEVIQEEYERKMYGRTDDAGIRWKPTQMFKEQGYMMWRTGDLLNSFQVETTNKGFRIFTNIEYAKYALGRRPAWPVDGSLPVRWINRMMDKITPIVRKYLENRIKYDL